MEVIAIGSSAITDVADHLERALAVIPDDNTAPFQARMHWKPDQSASSCKVCTKNFRFFRRRTHCRQCGEVVCGSCSPHRLDTFIPGCSTVSTVRVCEECKVKREAPGFSWERELAAFFGTDAAQVGAKIFAARQLAVDNNNNYNNNMLARRGMLAAPAQVAVAPPAVVVSSPAPPPFTVVKHSSPACCSSSHSSPPAGVLTSTSSSSECEEAECPICQNGLHQDADGLEDAEEDNTTSPPLGTTTTTTAVHPAHSLGTDPHATAIINNCQHQFHAGCLGRWLKNHSTCPMCRNNAFTTTTTTPTGSSHY